MEVVVEVVVKVVEVVKCNLYLTESSCLGEVFDT